MEQLRSLIKKLLQFRFVRFCITGGLNTLVDFIVFFLLTGSLKWPVIPSQVISYSAGILNSYCINRRWTFQTRNQFFGREMLWFIGVNLCVLGVSVLFALLCLLRRRRVGRTAHDAVEVVVVDPAVESALRDLLPRGFVVGLPLPVAVEEVVVDDLGGRQAGGLADLGHLVPLLLGDELLFSRGHRPAVETR